MRPIPRPHWMVKYVTTVPNIISYIRAHPVGVPPTLESIPQLNLSMMKGEPLSSIIRDMQETGFQHWGFVIYRCAYADNLQWESYLEFLKAAVEEDLELLQLDTLLWKYLEWTVVEDRAALDGATKQHIREQFGNWAADSAIHSDRPDLYDLGIGNMPRFKHCIYVDQKCLDTVDQYETWVQAGAEDAPKPVVCAIIDKDCKPTGRGRRGFPSVEGCTREDTGWMYTYVECITGVYNRLSYAELAELDYTRPPEVWPLADLMPLEP